MKEQIDKGMRACSQEKNSPKQFTSIFCILPVFRETWKQDEIHGEIVENYGKIDEVHRKTLNTMETTMKTMDKSMKTIKKINEHLRN